MKKIKVLIADDILETRKLIRKMFSIEENKIEIVAEASNGKEVIESIRKFNPDIILMDINMPVLNGLETTEIINEKYPNIIVIIMSVQRENEYLKKAMFAGAKEYIIKPLNYEELYTTIISTYNRYKKKEEIISKLNAIKRESKIISFYGSKGGVGKSIVALNTAIAYSKKYGKKVLLIDLDLYFGDIGMMLNEYKSKTLIDLIDENQTISYENIKEYLFSYNTNLDVLLAPRNPESAEYIKKDIVKKIIDKVKNYYDVIIFDNGVNFGECTLVSLDLSNVIAFVSNMELSSLKNMKIGLKILNTLNYSSKIKVIVNSENTKFGIKHKDILNAFSNEDLSFIPENNKTVKFQ